jgi:hypothetical protein
MVGDEDETIVKLVQAVEERVDCARAQYWGGVEGAGWVAELVWTFWGRKPFTRSEAAAGLTLKAESSGFLTELGPA